MILYYLESFKYVYANENKVLLDLDETQDLFDFLHKKIMKWLEPREKKIAALMGLLLTTENLSCSKEMVQYILYGGRPSKQNIEDLQAGLE
jgi:hypothetical protein